MVPWRFLRRIVAWLLVALSVLFVLAGVSSPRGQSTLVLGLIGLVGAYFLLGRPGLSRRRKKQAAPVFTPSQVEQRPQPTTVTAKRAPSSATSSVATDRLSALPTPAKISIVNHLVPDEEPELVLIGANGDAIVATDRRLFVIPDGFYGHERLWTAPYAWLTDVQIEQQRNGARLLISSHASPNLTPIVRLSGDAQVQAGINAVQQIRRQIAAARQTLGEEGAPSGQSAFIETAHRSIPSSRHRASLSLGDMLEMDPTGFEEFTGRALESLGYTNVRRVGGSGDLAADLTATDPQGRSAIVQCKRYTPGSKVGSPALQAFIGMKEVHHKVDRGIFVTTADYSQEAINLAKAHNIVLIDGDDLVKIAALVLTPPSKQANEETSGSVQYCPNCGTNVVEGGKFCRSCGASLS
jgi:restriction system protein